MIDRQLLRRGTAVFHMQNAVKNARGESFPAKTKLRRTDFGLHTTVDLWTNRGVERTPGVAANIAGGGRGGLGCMAIHEALPLQF